MSWYDSGWENIDDFWEELTTGPNVNEILFGNPSIMDLQAQELFVRAFFDRDSSAYIELVDYMWNKYHIDFEDAFEWADFRQWYENA